MDLVRTNELSKEHIAFHGPDFPQCVFLHGVLGRGQNLRTIAKKWADARPNWNVTVMDLRRHGLSQDVQGEDSIAQAARDVVDSASKNLRAIVGHSLGGKVALKASSWITPCEIVVLDSRLGSRQSPTANGSEQVEAERILRLLHSLVDRSFVSRNAFIEQLIERGVSRPTAGWLAMNLTEALGNWTLGLNLAAIRRLLESYFDYDAWNTLETLPSGRRVHLVIANRSDAFSSEDRTRAERLAQRNLNISVDIVESGHWVHVDAPKETLDVLLNRLPPTQ